MHYAAAATEIEIKKINIHKEWVSLLYFEHNRSGRAIQNAD